MTSSGRRWRRELVVVATCLAGAIAMTWPLARVFTTRFCGGLGDPQLTLWSMRWLRDAIVALENPFFTPRLHHPHGTTLVFHTFDLPTALLVVPLWGWLPEIAIYNVAVLFAFTLTAYGMARLAREVTGDELCAVLAGLLFAGVPYHYAHLRGHLHLVSMGWLPLFVVHLLRIVDDRSRTRDAVLAGTFLALASLASWYHLVFGAVITGVLVGAGRWWRAGLAGARRLLGRGALLGATWAVIAGPLLAAMVVTRQREPILGSHDAAAFSADASSFFDPAGMHALTDGEHVTFVGFTVLALALIGALSAHRARTFLVVAVVGGALTLGPSLQWHATDLGWRMPYGYLEQVIPGLDFSGVPVRFGYVLYFGLVVAAAFGLVALRRRFTAPMLGRGIVVALTAVALWEYWPGVALTTECPVPTPMREWAHDDRPWAVLDVSGGWSQMWHATIHGKPIVGGYLGRVPKRLEDWFVHQPVLASVAYPDGETLLTRVEPGIEFSPARQRHDDELIGDRLNAEWNGTLLLPTPGAYRFQLSASADAVLDVGTVSVAHVFYLAAGERGRREGSGALRLTAGPRPVRLRVLDAPRDVKIELRWAPPGRDLETIPASAFRTAGGDVGLDAEYRQHIPALSGLGRDAGRAALRQLSIRYVVTADQDNACVERELELPEVYRGEGVRIFEVPAGE
jgi:hypothetical protein